MPSYHTSRQETETIIDISKRARDVAAQAGTRLDPLDVIMAVTACHCNGTPLQLAELLAADEGNFAHDVGGILRHIDQHSGRLGECFTPRFAVRQ